VPIINLAVIGQLELLHRIYEIIVIPQAVYDEVAIKGREQAGAHLELAHFSQLSFEHSRSLVLRRLPGTKSTRIMDIRRVISETQDY
jgi:predicted nucleic acid-binding protein